MCMGMRRESEKAPAEDIEPELDEAMAADMKAQIKRYRGRRRVMQAGLEPWKRFVDRAVELEADRIDPAAIVELLASEFGKAAA